MRNPTLFSRIFNTPLMIQPSKLDAIIAGIGGRWDLPVSPGMALVAEGEYKRPGYEVIGNVAVIDIMGLLAHRGGFGADSSYILGYDQIGKQLAAAVNDTAVNSILLQIDSPGGEVAGAFELAAMIRQARETKPVNAVISSMAASAGYLIASAADSIAISATGIAGSIGVVLRHIDMSKAAEQDGISITYIYAGDHKIDGNPFEPLPKAVKADLQGQIDKLYSLFVTTVAANRGLDTEAIRAQQAQIYTGQDAIDAGLADRISTPDEILAEMQSSSTHRRSITMSNDKPDTALEQQALDKARAEGFAAGKQEGIAEGLKQGAKAERDRVAAVKGHETYAGREAAAAAMLNETAMGADEISKVLAAMPKAEPAKPGKPAALGQSEFEKAMAGIKNPQISDGPGDGSDDDDLEQKQAAAGWGKAFKPYVVNPNKGARS